MGRTKRIFFEEIERMYEEEGKTYQEIAEYYASQGIKISYQTIGKYYREGCKLQGKKPQDGGKNRGRNSKKDKVNFKEIERMYEEERKTYQEIVEYYTSQGIKISYQTIRKYYMEGCKLQGKKPQDGRKNNKNNKGNSKKDKVSFEEVIRMHEEEGKSYREIAEYYTSQGIKISWETIRKYYMEGCKLQEKDLEDVGKDEDIPLEEGKKDKQKDKPSKKPEKVSRKERIKQIIMQGQTIQEWMSQNASDTTFSRETLQKEAQKLQLVSECKGKRKDGSYIQDEDFLRIIKWVLQEDTKIGVMDCVKIQKELGLGRNLDVIQVRHFKNREETFSYLLSRLNRIGVIHITDSYDKQTYKQYSKRLSDTVDGYLQRVTKIEEQRKRKRLKEKEENPSIPVGDEK